MEVSFYLGLPRGCGELLSKYLEQSLTKESLGTQPAMGKIVSEARMICLRALCGDQAHFNAQVKLGTLLGMALSQCFK